jgi:hypothetical protein
VKRIARAAAATFLATAALTSVPAAAHAVTATGTDPTGDVAAGSTYDITTLGVDLTTSTVTVTVKFAANLPALSDPSWYGPTHTDGRVVVVSLGPDLDYPGFLVDRDGVFAVPSFLRDIPASCDDATVNLTTDTLTMQVDASCFHNPGKVKVEAVAQKGLEPANSDIDIAIAPIVTDNLQESDVTSVDAALPGGYYSLGEDGGIFAFGDAAFYGSTGNLHLNKPVVSMAAQPNGAGYRFVASDGGIFAYGNAGFYGSMGGQPLNKPVVGMATTPTGNGYWLVASDGGIFAYGDAAFYGSTGSITLNKPIVGMMPTPSGQGYWLIASDGGIFSYGDAAFYGSAGATALNSPIIGAVPSATGKGYYLAARDGGIFAYGDATFYGSGTEDFDDNVVAVGRSATGGGYYLADSTGTVENFGPALDFGDAFRLGIELNKPMVGLAVK